MHKALLPEDVQDGHSKSAKRDKNSITDWLAQQIILDSPQRVLDIGCGFGTLLASIRSVHSCDAIGLSPVRFTVDYARQFWRAHQPDSAPEIRLKRFCEPVEEQVDAAMLASGSNLSDESRSADAAARQGQGFDVVVALESIGYSEDLTATLAWVRSLLEQKGVVWLLDDWRRDPWSESCTEIRRLGRYWHRPRFYSIEDLLTAASEAGLSLVDRRDFTPRVPAVHRRPKPLRRICLKVLATVGGRSRLGEIASAFLGGWYLESLYQRGAVRYELIKLERLGS
ncbi:MAG: methyltransferase domain-containing protein [Pseudomonadota bacterium]